MKGNDMWWCENNDWRRQETIKKKEKKRIRNTLKSKERKTLFQIISCFSGLLMSFHPKELLISSNTFFFCETTREEAIKTNKQTRMKHFKKKKLNQRFTNIWESSWIRKKKELMAFIFKNKKKQTRRRSLNVECCWDFWKKQTQHKIKCDEKKKEN